MCFVRLCHGAVYSPCCLNSWCCHCSFLMRHTSLHHRNRLFDEDCSAFPNSIPRSSNPLCIALWSQVVSGSIWWMLQPGSISEPYTEDFPLTTDFLKGFLQFAMLLLQPVFLWSLFFIGTSTSFLSPKLRFSHVNHVEGRHFWKVMLHHISGKQKSCSKILQDGDFGQSPFFCEIH